MTVFCGAGFGLVLRVDHARWGQTGEDLRGLALSARHARSRERFLALHEIARGGCASEVAKRTGRHPQTVMGWLHRYNAGGPEAVSYRRTGGRPPFAQRFKPRSVRRSALPRGTRPGRP
jgi:Homeodomain-like domain